MKIPFGLKGGILVGVSEVDSGLACDCVCPSCHRKLQANKGKKISHYFSHNPSEDTMVCESAFETAIHLMAKQILSEEGSALFPMLPVKVSQRDINGYYHEEEGVVEEESLKKFDLVELEKGLDDIRPDIIAYQNSVPFLIEVAVTHFSDREKVELIRKKKIYAIEIDLSKVDYTITKEKLRKLIIDEVNNKKWLSHPDRLLIKQQLEARLEEKIKQINKNIYKSRNETKTRFRTNSTIQYKNYSPPKSFYKVPRTKQYNLESFLCEACRHIFEVPLKEAPYTIETIKCPECGRAVSAH